MVVLLVGGGGKLMDSLINKFTKCGHRVCLLTGNTNSGYRYERVRERYNFSYEDECIKDIISSVAPDLVIFAGAFDTNFNWDDTHVNTVRYISGLINILSQFALRQHGRFVYLSSEEVFGGTTYSVPITEDMPVLESGQRSMVLSQGEMLCANYNRADTETMILRLDHLYFTPKRQEECAEVCFQKCLSGLRKGLVTANIRQAFSMLHIKDAVEMIYQAAVAEHPEHMLYHISSMELTTDMALAEMISEKMDGVNIVDNSTGAPKQLVLSSERYRKEFNSRTRVTIADGVSELINHVLRHKNEFLSLEDRGANFRDQIRQKVRRIFNAVLPYLESILFFAVAYFLNLKVADSAFLARLDIYLLYVLLLAVVHGQRQAIIAALLSTLGFCFIGKDSGEAFNLLLDSNTYVWIAHLFIVGLIVGYMKDSLHESKVEADEQKHFLDRQVSNIADINDSNVRVKLSLESDLINQKESLGHIYRITSALNDNEPDELLFKAARTVSTLMGSSDIAIYRVANSDYARLFSSTSAKAREHGNSIKYSAMQELCEDIQAGRVYVNRLLDERYPMMANGIFFGDSLQLIIMMWDISYNFMTLGQADKLAVVSMLIQNAMLRANEYLNIIESQRFLHNTNIMNSESFARLVTIYTEARAENLCTCTLLEILPELEISDGDTQAVSLFHEEEIRNVGERLSHLIRRTDFLGVSASGRLYVMLTNTDRKNAEIVTARLTEAGCTSAYRETVL